MCFLNNQLVVRDTTLENYWEPAKAIYSTGQIELQNHGGPLWFKNIYIREIPPPSGNSNFRLTVAPGQIDHLAVVFCARDPGNAIPAARRRPAPPREPSRWAVLRQTNKRPAAD